MSAPLLVEVGCEELPAAVCRSFLDQLVGEGDQPGLVARLLDELRLLPGGGASGEDADAGSELAPGSTVSLAPGALTVSISPRRIAVQVGDVPERQTARRQRFRGPRAAVAFDETGQPTKAGLGFARSRGVAPQDLRREVVDGTEFAVAVVETERKPVAEVAPQFVERLITGLQVPRGMRWGRRPAGAADYLRFSRPIRWLVCKYGAETIRCPFYDLECGDVSRGHRVLGGPTTIESADHYRERLRAAGVIVDQEERRALIVAGLDAHARSLGGEWFDPGAVLDEAVYLAEWPSVHQGSFAARHLRLPEPVLVTAMQSHQRYFPVRRRAGELLPVFLYVANADPAAAAIVTRGNERVLEGRLDDAEFSYDRDLAEGLLAMGARLGAVVFHEKLGSLAERAERLSEVAGLVAERVSARAGGAAAGARALTEPAAARALVEQAREAARLAKADLVSQMVIEFPTLQGVMGGVYATAAGLPAAVAHAIAEHYQPLSATAPVPTTLVGAVVAIADKIDAITGAWVADERPSGSRDPYGLRRAAMGIVRIALEHDLRLTARDLIGWSLAAYARQGRTPADAATTVQEIEAFIWERLQGILLDERLPFPFVEAALGSVTAGPDLPTVARLARLFARRASEPFFNDVVVAYTRCASLAAKAQGGAGGTVEPSRFVAEAERELHSAVRSVGERVRTARQADDLEMALREAAALRPAVDRYFDEVLVMDPDPLVRANRLAQLEEVRSLLGAFGEFSRLSVQGS